MIADNETFDLATATKGVEAEMLEDRGMLAAFGHACMIIANERWHLGRCGKKHEAQIAELKEQVEKKEALLAESEADRQYMRNKLARAGL